MKKLPTAKEFFLKEVFPVSHESKPDEVELWYETDGHAKQSVDIMIEFAKMHVDAALKAASEKAKITYEYSGNTGSEYCDEYVDKDSILNSYPLENIK